MSKSLYRAYRPQQLSDVVGQQHVVTTIMHAIDQKRISHAYLFCGPRGTGKTTMARLLAKALLCEHGPYCNPCGTCSACQRIAAGEHVDVIEIDAASRTGVDSVRSEIISRVQYAATEGEFQIFIIDEAHMLSTPAFNALLKTLEEPPPHVIFILCTTDPQQVLETVRSRCQRFDFKPLTTEEIIDHLRFVCDKEGFSYEDEALRLVAVHAKGGMRDALSTLEQLAAFGGNHIELAQAQSMLGATLASSLSELVESIAHRNVAQCFMLIDQFANAGQDLLHIWRDLSAYIRDLYVVKVAGNIDVLPHASGEQATRIREHADLFESTDRLVRALAVLSEAERDMRLSNDARLTFELCCARLARPQADLTIEALAERVAALEAKAASQMSVGIADASAEHTEALNNVRFQSSAVSSAHVQQPEASHDSPRGDGAASTSSLQENTSHNPLNMHETTSSSTSASHATTLSDNQHKIDAPYAPASSALQDVSGDDEQGDEHGASAHASDNGTVSYVNGSSDGLADVSAGSAQAMGGNRQSSQETTAHVADTTTASHSSAAVAGGSSSADPRSAAFRARLESYWARTVASIKKDKPTIGAMVEKAYPTLEDQTLVLTIDKLGSFQKMMLARKENHQLLVEHVQRQFLRDFDVEIRDGASASPVVSRKSTQTPSVASREGVSVPSGASAQMVAEANSIAHREENLPTLGVQSQGMADVQGSLGHQVLELSAQHEDEDGSYEYEQYSSSQSDEVHLHEQAVSSQAHQANNDGREAYLAHQALSSEPTDVHVNRELQDAALQSNDAMHVEDENVVASNELDYSVTVDTYCDSAVHSHQSSVEQELAVDMKGQMEAEDSQSIAADTNDVADPSQSHISAAQDRLRAAFAQAQRHDDAVGAESGASERPSNNTHQDVQLQGDSAAQGDCAPKAMKSAVVSASTATLLSGAVSNNSTAHSSVPAHYSNPSAVSEVHGSVTGSSASVSMQNSSSVGSEESSAALSVEEKIKQLVSAQFGDDCKVYRKEDA